MRAREREKRGGGSHSKKEKGARRRGDGGRGRGEGGRRKEGKAGNEGTERAHANHQQLPTAYYSVSALELLEQVHEGLRLLRTGEAVLAVQHKVGHAVHAVLLLPRPHVALHLILQLV